MKKTKSIMLLSLLGLLVTGCGTSTSEKPTESTTETKPTEKPTTPATEKPTETPVIKAPDYYLAGNINLGDKENEKFNYDEATKTYSLTGISLKRGDAFVINGTEDAAIINFDSLTAKDGFEAGNGHYVKVLNEGIYTISIQDGALTLTKTGSNYTDVKLVYADGQDAISFAMKEDFTFGINDAPLRYRQQFHIEMDGEILGFDSMAFNPAYYKAFRFMDNNIESIKKGLFDITIDFSLAQPLVFTSDEIKEENQAPEDGDAYKKYIKQFADQFAEEGSKFTSESTVTKGGIITKKTVSETLNENQHYIQSEQYTYSEDQTAEGAITEEAGKENSEISKKEAILTSSNYYEIAKYEGSSLSKPSVSGAIIKDETETEAEADEPTSTLVNVFERKYLTTEKAKEKVIEYQAEYNNINTILGYFLGHAHISGSSSLSDDAIKDNIKIKSEYVGDIGDAMKIEFSNYEVAASLYGTSYYAINNLVLNIDEDGKIESGEYTMKAYEGSKIVDSNTKLPVENIEDYLSKTEVYKFSAEYGDRNAVDTFAIPVESNLVSELDAANPDGLEISSRVAALEMTDLGIMAAEPIAPIDLSNYKIMTYDSNFFSKNYNGSLSGKGKLGETTITIGNEYNLVTYDLKVNLVYEAFSSSSQLGNLTVDGKSISTVYVGQTYNFTLKPYEGYDPTDIKISASSDAITLSDFNSDEDKKATGTITFKLTVNRAETGVKINYGSKTKTSVSTSLSLTITDPWSAEKAAGTYDSSSSSNVIKFLTLNDDGTGSVGINSTSSYDYNVTDNYDFTYEINSTGKISLKTSEHVTALDLEMGDSEQHYAAGTGSETTTHKKVKINKIAIDNVDKTPSSSYYATYTERLAILCGRFTMVDEAGKEYTYVKTEIRTGVYEGVIYFTDGTTTSKFTFKAPSSSYSTYGAGVTNYYADASSSSYTEYNGSYTYSAGVYTVTFGAKVFTITTR